MVDPYIIFNKNKKITMKIKNQIDTNEKKNTQNKN